MKTTNFNLTKTITSGHIFAYDVLDDNAFIVLHKKPFYIRQTGNVLEYEGINKKELEMFFDLRRDLSFVNEYPDLESHKDIRLVRQDTRQAILTFIMSANNNQKRIKKMMDAFRVSFGEKQVIARKEVFTLPEQGTYSIEDLQKIGFGYRAKSVFLTDDLLTPEFIEKLQAAPYEKQRAMLMALPGVGPKVADCILAYSELSSPYAFPVDVWVGRAVKRRYARNFSQKTLSYKNIQEFSRTKFGEDASYLQHYFFLEEQARAKREQ